MKSLKAGKNIFALLPGASTALCLCVGLSAIGCSGGERDLFGIGFNCENPIHTNHLTCGTSGAITTTG